MSRHFGPIPILFTHYGDQWIRGSERLLIDLLTHLDLNRVHPVVWCNGVAMADAAKSAGFTTYLTDFAYYFDDRSPPYSNRHYWSVVREGTQLVRKHQIRLVHANSAAPCQWLVPATRAAHIPLLAHLHAPYLRRSRFVCLLHQASLIVGVSSPVVNDFIADGMAPDKTRVIYNGIDFARFELPTGKNPRSVLGVPDDAVLISTIGSLIRRKGQDVLIRALKRLDSTHDVHLLVVGDGPERTKLERLTADLGLQAQVHFVGHSDDLSPIYRVTDIVALASRAEAFGLVLAEAGYFALPTVATTVGGIPEVVSNGSTGLLVPPDDPVAFATVLRRLVEDRTYRCQLGFAARERVLKLFSVDRMVADFHDVYERLAQLPRRRLGWLNAAENHKPYLRLIGLDRASGNCP